MNEPHYISHILKDKEGNIEAIQSNEEYSLGVAELARQFANEFGMDDFGYIIRNHKDRLAGSSICSYKQLNQVACPCGSLSLRFCVPVVLPSVPSSIAPPTPIRLNIKPFWMRRSGRRSC